MNTVIFCGPTLGEDDLAPYAHFTIHPPVRQGELYKAAKAKPKAIGIIDGFFDGVPAVWHKEVLWALAAGVAVFGASSMGALRAAELHSFGMRGIGRIFEDYRDGRLTDDDEVALLHGPAEAGYLKLSDPMVNIRATLELAVAERVIDAGAANAIAAIAKAQFYQERTWASVLDGAAKALSRGNMDSFAAWLPGHQVDRKREDGLALLHAIEDFAAQGERQPPVSFSFEWTETWANAPWLDAAPAPATAGNDEGAAILDELRLDGEAYLRVRRAALLQSLSRDEAARTDLRPTRKDIARATMKFRSPRGLRRQSDVERWSAENDIGAARFAQLMADRSRLEELARLRDADLQEVMLDELRLENIYPKLRRRARAKARALAAGDAPHPKAPPSALVAWYFGARLKGPVPDDLAGYAAGIGLSDLREFYALIAAEYAVTARSKRKNSGRVGK
jgi:hypothetical protein